MSEYRELEAELKRIDKEASWTSAEYLYVRRHLPIFIRALSEAGKVEMLKSQTSSLIEEIEAIVDGEFGGD